MSVCVCDCESVRELNENKKNEPNEPNKICMEDTILTNKRLYVCVCPKITETGCVN